MEVVLVIFNWRKEGSNVGKKDSEKDSIVEEKGQ